jgi:8-oxo-dGTP pyrophosphatase MutT (NUDIX family)
LTRFGPSLRARVESNLARFARHARPDPELKHAAVAATLVGDASGQACFLITRRASGMRNHPGQWALPGGRVDAGETAEETALRELHEELGLALELDAVLGLLDDFVTRSGYVITPVVCWGGEARALVPSPDEVEAVYVVPVRELEHPDIPKLSVIPESDRPVLSLPMPVLGTSIHAPTAAVLYQLREVALHGRKTRVAHYEQPVFAWS